MNTVIVPDVFEAEDSYTVVKTGTIDRAQTLHYFFEVPAGTPAFKVDLAAPDGVGHIRFLRWHPWGVGIDSNAVSNCYINPTLPCTTGASNSRTVQDPLPGVWEVSVDARRNSAADDAAFTLTASVLGASVEPDPDVIPEATVGLPEARSYTATNLFGAFTGRMQGTPLGSAFLQTPTIADGEVQEYTVAVPEGATSLRATIGNTSDLAADLDLFVENPAGVRVGQSADGDSEESVTINGPAAGTWTVVVDGFAIPDGTTTYDYIDVFFTTTPMGQISVTDANALRPAGGVMDRARDGHGGDGAHWRPGAVRQRRGPHRYERSRRAQRRDRGEGAPCAVADSTDVHLREGPPVRRRAFTVSRLVRYPPGPPVSHSRKLPPWTDAVVELLAVRVQHDLESVDQGLGVEHSGLRAVERPVTPRHGIGSHDLDVGLGYAGPVGGVAEDGREDVGRNISGHWHSCAWRNGRDDR